MDWKLRKKVALKENVQAWLNIRKEQRDNKVKKLVEPYEDSKIPVKVRPKTAFYDGHNFAASLEKRGFKLLGHGAFSCVYAKEGQDKVIKVTRNPTDGWINYINWASKKGYAGGFAPRVYSYKYIRSKGGDFSLAVMERLDKTVHHAGHKHDARAVYDLLHLAANDNQMARTLIDLVSPGIVEFNDKLRKLCAGLDLHGGNFMVRKDNTLVFTDPVTNWNGRVIKTRMKSTDFSIAA